MNTQDILKVIIDSLTSFTPLKPEQIQLESQLGGDLALDSQEELELVFDLESKLNMTIPSEDFETCKTIGDIVSLILRTKAA